ncbi:MAG: hypothetical protein ACOYON_01605 [Fimbriimonas sp.]
MNRHFTPIALATVLASVAIGQIAATGGSSVYRDQRDDMMLRQFVGSIFRYGQEDGVKTISFKVSGEPTKAQQVEGRWRTKGLDVFADQIEGLAAAKPEGGYALRQGTMSGGVKLYATSKDKNEAVSTLDVRSEKVLYAAGKTEDVATIPTPMTLYRYQGAAPAKPDEADQTLRITGRSATLYLDPDPLAKERLRRANIVGDVRIIVRKIDPKKKANSQFEAKGNRAETDRSSGTLKITLIGNVTVDGFDDSNLGSVRGASRAEITLDEENNVKEIALSGEPTTTTLKKSGGRQ